MGRTLNLNRLIYLRKIKSLLSSKSTLFNLSLMLLRSIYVMEFFYDALVYLNI